MNVKEFQSLCLDINVLGEKNEIIEIKEDDDDVVVDNMEQAETEQEEAESENQSEVLTDDDLDFLDSTDVLGGNETAGEEDKDFE